MATHETRTRETVEELLNDEVSTNAGFYLARVAGEHPKYGVDREWVTAKNSPYSLDPISDVHAGEVYELKDGRDDKNVRAAFVLDGIEGASGADTVAVEVTVIDAAPVDGGAQDTGLDNDEVLAVFESDDASDAAQARDTRQRAHDLVDAADPDDLAALVDVLDNAADRATEDPSDLARTDLASVPDSVRQDAQLYHSSFATAVEKHTGVEPSTQLRAAAIDAAVLAQKQKRKRQNGGE